MTVSTNSGTNSGTVKILDGANQNIEITPNGSGKINLDGLLWPNADGSSGQVLSTNGSGALAFVANTIATTLTVIGRSASISVPITAANITVVARSGNISVGVS
jgi:ABC-type hemin transport system ATPase subunit